MRVVLVEDEAPTLRLLKNTILQVAPQTQVVKTFSQVSTSVDWFNTNPEAYDLVFMDIRLSDGLSLEIFSKSPVNAPVIFVTAYDEYALEAFNTNGIAYLLKPIDEEQVKGALEKLESLTAKHPGRSDSYQNQIDQLIQQLIPKQQFRRSFLIHHRDKLIPLKTGILAWIYTQNETCKAQSKDGHSYIIDGSLEKIMEQLDPEDFYRANRQYIVNRNAIEEVHFYFNGRLALQVTNPPKERILVSKARAAEFKAWMDR